MINIKFVFVVLRRYFLAVQGDSRRKGELFGVRNLFRVNPLGQCLTADILLRNRAMEEKVRGKSHLAIAIQVFRYIPPSFLGTYLLFNKLFDMTARLLFIASVFNYETSVETL